MDDELITQRGRWKINWKWVLALSAFALITIVIYQVVSEIQAVKKERAQGVVFDQEKWKTKNTEGYPYRNKMLKDLVANDKRQYLKHLKKQEIIDLLGQPDRTDNAYLFYTVTQERLQFFPLHTTTLVIKLSNEGTGNTILIHE